MISNLLKNAVIALLLHAATALAFNPEEREPAAAGAGPVQTCAVPAAPSGAAGKQATYSDTTGAHS